MKLLIISSEPLNSLNTLSSTFELSQAKIMGKIAEVAIISVSPQDSLSAALKDFFKKLISFRTAVDKEGLFFRLKDILFALILKKNRFNVYSIEGVPVYEGKNYKFYSKTRFLREVRGWVNSGLDAYTAYEAEFGKPDILHAHGRFMFAGALALEIGAKRDIPYVYTEHSSAYRSGLAPAAAKPILNRIVDHASAIVAVSKALLSELEAFLGRRIKDAIILPNVLDPIFETPVSKVKSEFHFKFINIASLIPIKGVDILLKAFKTAFDGNKFFQLTICGDGPLKNELTRLCSELGLQDCVFFTGNVSKEAVKCYLDGSAALVVSSLRETFGVAVIEAMSRGCPVIATRCGGPQEIVTAESGILVDPGNPEELSAALKEMAGSCQNYDGNWIHHYAVSNYGSNAFLASSEELYGHVINRLT